MLSPPFLNSPPSCRCLSVSLLLCLSLFSLVRILCCPPLLPLQTLCLPSVPSLSRLAPLIMSLGHKNVPRSLLGCLLLFLGSLFIPCPNKFRCLPKQNLRLRPIHSSLVTLAAGLSRSCIIFFTTFSGLFFVGSSPALFPPRRGNVPRATAWHGEGRPSLPCELSRLVYVCVSPRVCSARSSVVQALSGRWIDV